MNHSTRLSSLILAVWLTSLGWIAATAGHAQSATAFGETVEVELVNVEVWVTDDDGHPAVGLPSEAFRLKEDGDEKDVMFFAEVRPRIAKIDTDESQSERPVTSLVAGATPARETGHLVLYLDQLHLTARGQAQIIDQLSGLLDSGAIGTAGVAPENVLILRQDESLYIEAPFGSSRAQLRGAIQRLAGHEPRGAAVELERAATLRRLQERWEIALQTAGLAPVDPGVGGQAAACAEFIRAAPRDIHTHAELGRQRISTTLDHLAGVSGFLSALDGTKSLIYVSDSLEINPGMGLFAFIDSLCPGEQAGRSDFRTRGELDRPFHRLARDAAANRVTFYGVQAGGMRANLALNADRGNIDLRGAQKFESGLRSAERGGLIYLAAETGGRAIYNRNDLTEDLVDVAEELNSFYSLAYSPNHQGRGEEHRIEVELTEEFRGRGLRVRHRKGYLHKSSATRLVEHLDAALFLGLGENPLTVRLAVGDASPTPTARPGKAGIPGKTFDVPLHVYVPVSSVAFVPNGKATMAHVFVRIAARDADGDRTDLVERVWKIEGPAKEDSLLDLRFDLELGPGLRTLAVAVRDELSRETSFVSTTLAVPTPQPPVAAQSSR